MSKTLTKKERYVREIKSCLQQASAIVNDIDTNAMSIQELKAAATQATQASTMLHRLEGLVEGEQG